MLIVVLAIAIGMFSIGTVAVGYSILDREMSANYMATNPASAVIMVDHVNDSLLNDIKNSSTVSGVEARGYFQGRILIAPNEWQTLQLYVINNFSDIRISTMYPEQGAWPPGTGDILIERAALPLTNAKIGDLVTVKTLSGPQAELRIAGTVYDPGKSPAPMEDTVYGYITTGTLGELGEPPYLNQLLVSFSTNDRNETAIRNMAYQLGNMVQEKGFRVISISVPTPGKHPNADQMSSLLFLFEAFGILSFVLSMTLTVNMITGMLAQQVRQIGMMKAVGATTRQVMSIYFSGVFILGILATAISIPASVLAGRALSAMVAGMLNLKISSYAVPLWVFVLLSCLGLVMPVLSAAYPIYRGCRVSVNQAVNDYGISAGGISGKRDRGTLLGRIPWISRPLVLSVRNTFRRRERLVLTLLTLAIGGALFIVSMNINASIGTTTNDAFNSWHYDAMVTFATPYPADSIRQNISSVPGVTQVECWDIGSAALVHPDSELGNQFSIVGLPPDTKIIDLPVTSGRWLLTGDGNAIVLDNMLVDMLRRQDNRTVGVGQDIVLSVNGSQSTWHVVGIVREITAQPTAYVNYEYYSRQMGQQGLAQKAAVVTSGQNSGDIAPTLEQDLNASGMSVQSIVSQEELRKMVRTYLQVITSFLVIMSSLAIIVGCLGLVSTMNINIIERRREIGVMRAIGASNRAIYTMIAVESLVIGLLSWFLANLLAPPISILIGNIFGTIIFKSPLDISFSPIGVIAWLVLVIILAPLSSLLSARNALRMPVHEVLAYE